LKPHPLAITTYKTFKNRFDDAQTVTVRSPGRVNIIGEHTDYNEGFVLPASIDKACYVTAGKRKDDAIGLYSVEFMENAESGIHKITPVKGWPNYILGVADQLIKRNYPVSGFNLAVSGDVPIGAGLSSSAALECATAVALNELFQLNISKMELADIAQKAEHSFAGVNCGIMDQFASIFGKKDHVIKLDCRSLEYEYVPLAMAGYKIVLLNTNVKHSLASTEYNKRRRECEAGVALVHEKFPAVNSLRDITPVMLEEILKPVDPFNLQTL
jgi:galactokinase